MTRVAVRSAGEQRIQDDRLAAMRRPAAPNRNGERADLVVARAMLRMQRDRAKFLPGDLFCDPAWHMLLELYVLDALGRPISVSGLCAASEIPHTTALRWIGRLVDSQLIDRHPDLHDARRTWLKLTFKGRAQLEAYFEAASEAAARE